MWSGGHTAIGVEGRSAAWAGGVEGGETLYTVGWMERWMWDTWMGILGSAGCSAGVRRGSATFAYKTSQKLKREVGEGGIWYFCKFESFIETFADIQIAFLML